MLVLTRRVGEEIVIGDEIRLMVVRIKGNRMRLGIMAPPRIAVARNEQPVKRAEAGPPREATLAGGTRSFR